MEIMEILASLNRQRGITVVMVTHEPDMARYASRIVRFKDGVIVEDVPNQTPTPVRPRALEIRP
jgi:putative ABC transport system ATP-binding protein